MAEHTEPQDKRYEPTSKEIYSEMWDLFKSDLPFEKIKKLGTPIGDFLAGNARSLGWFLIFPYIVPTTFRLLDEVSDDKANKFFRKTYDSEGFGTGIWLGTLEGLFSLAGQFGLYAYLSVYQEQPEWLAIPLATNIGSGIYECVRSKYKTAKKNLIEKHGSDISDIVDSD